VSPTADPASRRRRVLAAAAVVVAVAAWSIWSYRHGGLMRMLIAPPAGVSPIEAVRRYVLGFGLLAPVVYVGAVTIEVLVAPIPGTLLYAPAGAIFGGLIGGALSLVGNVIGAALACWLGAAFGERWVARHSESGGLAALRERLRSRGAWVVFLLRVNPFTSSDLVSYAAGLAGLRVGQVALGTLAGMAPLCFLQAYLAETLLGLLPGWAWVVGSAGGVVLVAVLLSRGKR
jgi:uncharacterized membrane protein YdjX (TVP38/TMEM64 family)